MKSDLPFEVLCEILSYLDVFQRLVAALVCRRWLMACSTQMGDVCLNLNPHRMRCQTPLPTLPLTRPFCNVTLDKTNIDQRCVDFLNYLGPQLLHLVVINSNLICCRPSVIECPQLRSLVTDSADIVTALKGPMAHLQSLDLVKVNDGSDFWLGLVEAISPNLREFKIPRSVAFDRRVRKRFYPDPSLPPSPLVLTTWAVEAFIAKHAATLTSLCLPLYTPVDVAHRIASTPGLALTDVDIPDCNGLAGSLGQFFKMQPRVVALNVSGVKLEYEELETVVRLLPGLRMLSLDCGFNEQALALVFRLRHLRRLCTHCKTIPPDAFSTFASVDLRVLDVGFILDDETVQELLKRAPALRELKMGNYRKTFFRDGPNIRPINH